MSMHRARALALTAISWFFVAACEDRPGAYPTISLETVQELRHGDIRYLSYQIEGDKILVTVVDKHGDGHIHQLARGGVTPVEAVELLDRKQAELSRSR